MATSSSISDLIKNDHASIKQAYQNYVSADDNLNEQERWANEFRWELARHIVAEELIFYPAFEKYLDVEGKKLAHQNRAEHQEVSPSLLPSRINFVLVLNRLKICYINSKQHRCLIQTIARNSIRLWTFSRSI
jgi:hypothetical protein